MNSLFRADSTKQVAFTRTGAGVRSVPVLRWRSGRGLELDDWVSEEVPVALEFNGISHAVMLATPCDLEDFALGFGLSEGIFEDAAELYGCEMNADRLGITLSMEVSARSFASLKNRRRTLAGRTGCGVCGAESLANVLRPIPPVSTGVHFESKAILAAVQSMRDGQMLNAITGSMHAAAWCNLAGEVRVLREDVGRHNALDKLVGALASAGLKADQGFIAVTSRASIEMVQKAAMARAPLLAAVSAPTQLAVDAARRSGMSLVGLARQSDLVIYAHPGRISLPTPVSST